MKASEEIKEQLGYPTEYEGQAYDIMLHALLGKWIGWLSPAAISLSQVDWLSHLFLSPAKQMDLVNQAFDMGGKLTFQLLANMGLIECENSELCVHTTQNDKRFAAPEWESFPFNFISSTFLTWQEWWNLATTHIRGVSKHHQEVINFTVRQMIDTYSPSNFPWTNPEVLTETFQTGGKNFIDGYHNYLEDMYRNHYKLPPVGVEKYQVGKDVAITPGKVIYRNHLMELIQYEPQHKKVYPEPILIIPAWIMKYYILDLSPHNSLVKYLVGKGHTVFMISWKNPGSEDRNLELNDYLHMGIMQAISIIREILPKTKIHAAGYCLGGTLLAIAAAWLAGQNDDSLASMTLFATQVDFREAGELSLFIDHSQIAYLEDLMWEKGYLDGPQMSWAFSMLRSNDLIWSRMVHDYLLGKRRPLNDLMAWDADTTRLPYRMHSEYLHNLFLNNELIQGHYRVRKKHVSLADIQLPLFVVATQKDHVSPWRSVYKIQLFLNADTTFILTSGGHNAGIVSEPGHPRRSYQMKIRKKDEKYTSPDIWQYNEPFAKGSWWPKWARWLADLSGKKIPAPSMGIASNEHPILGDAPGVYVLKK